MGSILHVKMWIESTQNLETKKSCTEDTNSEASRTYRQSTDGGQIGSKQNLQNWTEKQT